jgi:metal-responsive CopG/Arc/MetJ family transcriptional regulator
LTEKATIEVPKDLFDAIDKAKSEHGFEKVDDFVVYMLRTWVDKDSKEEKFSEEDSKRVEANLKAMGYM